MKNCNVFVAKADGLWFAYAVIAGLVAFLFYQSGVHAEKIGWLEDKILKMEE